MTNHAAIQWLTRLQGTRLPSDGQDTPILPNSLGLVFVCKLLDFRMAPGARIFQIGLQLLLCVYPLRQGPIRIQFRKGKGRGNSESFRRLRAIIIEPEYCMIGDEPEFGKFWLQFWLGPEARTPKFFRAGIHCILQRFNGGTELVPEDFFP